MNKIRDSHDFAISDRECYFCGKKETIRFHEHYTFCPNCSAIYTTSTIQQSGCKHIKDGIPEAIRAPWYKESRKKTYITEEVEGVQICSVCGKECISDGW